MAPSVDPSAMESEYPTILPSLISTSNQSFLIIMNRTESNPNNSETQDTQHDHTTLYITIIFCVVGICIIVIVSLGFIKLYKRVSKAEDKLDQLETQLIERKEKNSIENRA